MQGSCNIGSPKVYKCEFSLTLEVLRPFFYQKTLNNAIFNANIRSLNIISFFLYPTIESCTRLKCECLEEI